MILRYYNYDTYLPPAPVHTTSAAVALAGTLLLLSPPPSPVSPLRAAIAIASIGRRHSGHYRHGRYSSYPTPNRTPTNTTLLFYIDGMYYYYGDTRNTRMEEERQRMSKAMLAAQRSGRTKKDDGLP